MKDLFQSLNHSNQRILIISISVSLVLISLSCFVLTINNSFASAKSYPTPASPKTGVGIQGSYVYYFGEDERLRRMPVNQAID